MEMIYRKIADLKRLESNPRTITEVQLQKLKESIKRNPDYFEARPLILSNRTGELTVIAGNQRLEACDKLGIKEVPTFLIEGLTLEREREIIIRDNVSNGEWDFQKLMEWNCSELLDWGIEDMAMPSFEEMDECPDELTAPRRKNLPYIKIAFSDMKQLMSFEKEMKSLLEKYEGVSYVLGGGEL